MNRNKFEQEFRESMEGICFSDGEKASLRSRLECAAVQQKKGDRQMQKKKSIPRAAVIAIALVLATTASVFGAGRVKSIGSSSHSGYDYTTPEEVAAALEKAGLPALPETVGDGFAMEGGTLVNNKSMDESDQVVDSWESIFAGYKDGEERILYVEMSRYNGLYEEPAGWEATGTQMIGEVEVRYDHTEHFMVPPDYEVDEETKEREETDDHFAIGYGAAEPETMFFDTVRFTKEDTAYTIYSSDGISGEELFAIAEQVME